MMKGEAIYLRRGLYHSGLMRAPYRRAKYFGETFRRSGIDPNYTGVAGRESQIEQK